MTKLQSKLYMGFDMKEEYNPVLEKPNHNKAREVKSNSLKMEGTAFIGGMVEQKEEIEVKKTDLLRAIRSGRNVLEENRENMKATLSPELEKDFKYMFRQFNKFKSLSSRKGKKKQENKKIIKSKRDPINEELEDIYKLMKDQENLLKADGSKKSKADRQKDMHTITDADMKEVDKLIKQANKRIKQANKINGRPKPKLK